MFETINWTKLTKLRKAYILERDEETCQICGRVYDDTYDNGESLTIDHVVPLSKDGTNNPDNLRAVCQSCNKKKGNEDPSPEDVYYIKARQFDYQYQQLLDTPYYKIMCTRMRFIKKKLFKLRREDNSLYYDVLKTVAIIKDNGLEAPKLIGKKIYSKHMLIINEYL